MVRWFELIFSVFPFWSFASLSLNRWYFEPWKKDCVDLRGRDKNGTCFFIASRVSIWPSSSPEVSLSDRSPGTRCVFAFAFVVRMVEYGCISSTRVVAQLYLYYQRYSPDQELSGLGCLDRSRWLNDDTFLERSFPALALAPSNPSSPSEFIKLFIRRPGLSVIYRT